MDTPGLDSFGLDDLGKQEILKYFTEWDEIAKNNFLCRFKNCEHIYEPNCGVHEFLNYLTSSGTDFRRLNDRLKLWQKLIIEFSKKTSKSNRN